MTIDRLTVRLPDAEIACEANSADPRTVLLHGFGGDMQVWDGVWSRISGELAALRYDLRGLGASTDQSEAPFSHADDLLSLLDARRIDSADLVGVSLGGAIALHFALDHPDRVNRLVLVSPQIMAWEWSEEWQAAWHPIATAAQAGELDEARRLWWLHPFFRTTRASEGADALAASIARFSGAQWVRDDQRHVFPDLERLHLLRAPAMLLTGQEDLPDFRLMADLLAASIPDVERIDLPGRGHMLPLEDPEACANLILRFLA